MAIRRIVERREKIFSVCLFLCVMLQAVPVPCGAIVRPPTRPVIQVVGETTLDSEVVSRIAGLEQEPGLSAEQIRKRLLDSNLFSFVRVSRTRRYVKMYLRQKVTWFVIPYASSDQAGTYYSLTAGKAVIAHEDVFAYARYQAGTSDHEGSFGLKGRSLLGSAWDAGAEFEFQNNLKWTYAGREIVQRTGNDWSGGSLEVAYRIGLPWKLSEKNYVEHHRFETPDGRIASGLQWSSKSSLEHDDYFLIDGLGEGHRASFYLETTIPAGAIQFTKIGAEGSYSLFRDGDFDWVILPRVDLGWNLPFYQLFELGGESLRGFPSEQFRDRYDFVIQNNLFLESWTVSSLRPRLLVFSDWAFTLGEGRTAAGAGIQVGVRDLLFSAIQVLGGYGWNPDGFSATISLGQKF